MPNSIVMGEEALTRIRNWANGKFYSKPVGGIPRADLASDISNGAIPFIVGTQTETTATWTGNAPTISSLYSGLTIKYYLSQTSASGTTLNLTLADGTKTGALRIYLKGSTRVTTHFAKGSVIFLTYLASADNNVGRNAWFVTSPPYYPDGDNYNTRYNFTLTAGDTSESSSIRVFTSKSTTFYTLAKGLSFRVDMPILYAPALETDGTSSSSYLVYYSANLTGNDANLADLTAGLPVYIKGAISGNVFTVDSTDLFTQTEPSSADGKAYIYLGVARSLTNIFLESEHPIYRYIDGAFQNADTLFASISDGDSGAY